ncbi:MAG: hypothetical protein ACRCXZ_09540, partial [Patescibacteria group bacterium]
PVSNELGSNTPEAEVKDNIISFNVECVKSNDTQITDEGRLYISDLDKSNDQFAIKILCSVKNDKPNVVILTPKEIAFSTQSIDKINSRTDAFVDGFSLYSNSINDPDLTSGASVAFYLDEVKSLVPEIVIKLPPMSGNQVEDQNSLEFKFDCSQASTGQTIEGITAIPSCAGARLSEIAIIRDEDNYNQGETILFEGQPLVNTGSGPTSGGQRYMTYRVQSDTSSGTLVIAF